MDTQNQITVAGNTFIPTNAKANSDTHGFYKKSKNGILFMGLDKAPVAFLVANRWGERFFVSASRHSDGNIWYMYGLSEPSRKFLGTGNSMDAERIWKAAAHAEAGLIMAAID